jgi:hypothetical protein
MNVLVVLLELFSWVLLFPEALKHFREVWNESSISSTKQNQSIASPGNTSAELGF